MKVTECLMSYMFSLQKAPALRSDAKIWNVCKF